MRIEIKDLHLGGISDSKYSGLPNSAYKIEGFNLHEEPGVIKVQQTSKADRVSGDTPAGNIVSIVPASDAVTYFFGETGVVSSRTNLAAYSELGTVSPAAIIDAKEFNGDIYYTTTTTVGKYTPGDLFSSRNDSFKTLTSSSFHPLIVMENELFVGNKNVVGKIEAGASSGGAVDTVLTLDSNYTIESFGNRDNNLVIGTRAEGTGTGVFAGFSRIFDWDLTSIGWINEKIVPELGISAFMNFNGTLLFNAGAQGMLYSWNGSSATPFKRLPGDWTLGRRARIALNSASSYLGRLIFGVSFENGAPLQTGMYSLGGYDPKYPNVFNLEFISRDGTDAARYLSSAVINNDFVYSVSSSTVSTIDRVDTTNKYNGANIETQVINVDRDKWKSARVKICYRSLPSGSTITLGQKINDAASYSDVTLTDYSNKKYLETNVKLFKANNIQFKVSTTRGTATSSAPEIMSIIIDFDESEK